MWIRTPDGWFDPVTNKLAAAPEGYNPSQYAPADLAEAVADYVGGEVIYTEPTGPVKPPPQALVEVGGVQLNAGLLAERYAKYPRELADRMTQEELALAGVAWKPPAGSPPEVALGVSTVAVSEPQPQRAGEPAPTVTPGAAAAAKTAVKADAAVDLRAQLLQAAARYGSDRYGWDQWNWIYREVTGETGPAPEDRGLRRNDQGLVLIDGKAMYTLDVWAARAGIALGPAASVPAGGGGAAPSAGAGAGPATTGGAMEPDLDARMRALAAEHGSDRWGWDEWNWFYHEVTGQDGPAPEDRGLSRDPSGAVLINGVAKYPYETWKEVALGSGPVPSPGGTVVTPGVPPPGPVYGPNLKALIPLGIGLLALRGLLR